MPWGWGRKEGESSPGANNVAEGGPSAVGPLPSTTGRTGDSPLPGAVRFRVDNVYTITGTGYVVVGEVVEGMLRTPTTLNLVTATPRSGAPASIQVAGAMAHHKVISEIAPGSPVALTLRGLPPVTLVFGKSRCPVVKGDYLVSPPDPGAPVG